MNGSRIDVFKNELLQNPSIKSVTYSNQSPLEINRTTTWVDWEGNIPRQEVNFTSAGIGYDYLQTMDVQLKEGRDFSPRVLDDTLNVIINEEAARQMGLAEPLGHEITTTRDRIRTGKIIGVVKDFHMTSLHTPITPLCLFLDLWPQGANLSIRIEAEKTASALTLIENTFRKHNPDDVFKYTFTSEKFKRHYASEELLKKLANAFSLLAIVICCLGLFGLVAYSAEQRTKEIGIRKVLGATVANIVGLLSTDFMKLIFTALIICIPIGMYVSRQWLNNFVYHTELKIVVFASGALCLLVVALLAIALKAIRAAQANPIESLKNE
jgi:ABC-type antimicrobial peptide transport system permease subunit